MNTEKTENIVDQLRHIIADQLDVNLSVAEISPDTPLFEGGIGLDSVAIMEFITLIEENFGFEFARDELNLKPFENLRVLSEFVNSKLSGDTASAST
jgi:acyl carrier protein